MGWVHIAPTRGAQTDLSATWFPSAWSSRNHKSLAGTDDDSKAMSLTADYVVVGSGLTGATIARLLADAGREVIVLERRSHVGGNVHDHVHSSGIRIHTYGPHYFRTNSQNVWRFVNRFASFHPYQAVVKSWVDGSLESWPVTEEYIQRVVGPSWAPAFQGTPRNFEEACLRMMPLAVYKKFVEGYTQKQWGVKPRTLVATLAGRFEVRRNGDARLKTQRYQGIPTRGYTAFMEAMLAGIPVIVDFDYLLRRQEIRARRALVFTGAIDEFFDFDLGRLRYKAQQRVHKYLPGVDFVFPVGQVNYPSLEDGPHIRTLEWKHMMPRDQLSSMKGSVLTTERPCDATLPNEYEYPFPDTVNRLLWQRYSERAARIPKLLIAGRLGEYRYYDMDQAIARAMQHAQALLTYE